MRYRVYIKPIRENLLNPDYIEIGSIDNSGVNEDSNDFLRTRKIPIKQNTLYQLKEIGYSDYNYYIYEYEFEDDDPNTGHNIAIANSLVQFDITENDYLQYYKPKHPNANYVRLKINRIRGRDSYISAGTSTGSKNQRLLKNRKKSLMFLESSDAILIHDSHSPEKTDHLLNANLDMADSSAGSFTFTIYKGHPYYENKINLWTDTIYITRIYKDGSECIIWDGRPINYEQTTDGITYYCEGALGYFNDLRVIDNSDYGLKVTPKEFVDDYIVYRKNKSLYYDRMDRTFFINPTYKIIRNDDNGQKEIEVINHNDLSYPDSFKYIDIDTDYKNIWALRRESGLKWLNDICESYGAHMKIIYNKYDSPKDEIITRKLVMIKDFDKGYICYPTDNITQWGSVNKGYVFWDYVKSNNVLSFYKTKLYMANPTRTNLVSSTYSTKIITDPSAVIINKDVLLEKPEITINTSGSLNFTIIYNPDHGFDSYYINSDKYCWTIYDKSSAKNYKTLYVTFGIDIFDAKKVSEIKSFATRIIPRGASCSKSVSALDASDTNQDTEESNIYLTTTGAFVDGNYKTTFENPNGRNVTVQGYRQFTIGNGTAPTNEYGDPIQDDCIEDIELIKRYGYVDAVVDFESANTPKELYNLAMQWFKDLKKEIVKTSIDISLTDFGQLDFSDEISFYYYTDPEYVDIWTQIYAKIPELDIGTENPSEHYAVVSLSIPLDDPLNTKITLANHKDMISDNVIVAGDIRGTPKGIIDSGSR